MNWLDLVSFEAKRKNRLKKKADLNWKIAMRHWLFCACLGGGNNHSLVTGDFLFASCFPKLGRPKWPKSGVWGNQWFWGKLFWEASCLAMARAFRQVFELLKSKLPKQVFVFSDMQFAEAGGDHFDEPVLRKVQKDYEKLKLELPELLVDRLMCLFFMYRNYTLIIRYMMGKYIYICVHNRMNIQTAQAHMSISISIRIYIYLYLFIYIYIYTSRLMSISIIYMTIIYIWISIYLYTYLSYLILSYIILSYPSLSYLIISYPILSYLILSYPILSYFILSYPILSYLILSYSILSYPALSCFILSYPVLSCLILSYPILSYLILSIYPSICLSVYLFICLSVYLSICLFVYLSIYLSFFLSFYLCTYLSIHPSIYIFIYLSIYPSIHRSIYLSKDGTPTRSRLVFWNLAADQSGAPALANDAGVVLMSGFSAQMFKSLMNPEAEAEAEAEAEVEQIETCKGTCGLRFQICVYVWKWPVDRIP